MPEVQKDLVREALVLEITPGLELQARQYGHSESEIQVLVRLANYAAQLGWRVEQHRLRNRNWKRFRLTNEKGLLLADGFWHGVKDPALMAAKLAAKFLASDSGVKLSRRLYA
jgi:hypothetical protein